MKISKQLLMYFLLIAVSIGFWITLTVAGFLNGIEEETLRWRYLVRGQQESTAPIVYVDLDAETISYMGDRPWDRREFGVLLAALLGPGQADAVSIDIILSKFGGGALLDLERARQGDDFLGKVVEAYASRIVLAAAYTGVQAAITNEAANIPLIRDGVYGPETAPFPEAPTFPIIQFEVGRLGLANVDEVLSGGVVPYYVPGFVELSSARYSFHLIDGGMRQKGHFMNEPKVIVEGDEVKLTDQDGWTTMVIPKHHEMMLFSLGLETFLAANDLNENAVKRDAEKLTVYRDGEVYREIPLVQNQSIEVNWLEGWNLSRESGRISMQEVLRNADVLADAARAGNSERISELEGWFERFKDKVIFVGAVDPQLKDLSPTPFNREPVPKVGLHANLYRTIQEEAYIRRVDLMGTVALISLLSVAVSSLALGRGIPRLLSVLLLCGYVGFAFIAFARWNWVIPLIPPVASTITATSLVGLLKLGSEEWQRRRIKNLFGAYVSPNLVNEMVDSERDPELGGTEAEVTALFSDVEGFSAISEQLGPERLVALMNEYLGAMTATFQSQQGTLDKYVGDAIVTMFGMPYPVKDHAARACFSAVAMQERNAKLRAEWAASGEWPEDVVNMRTRIGINTGVAVIGNIGSEMRFNYTMMGDSVNLAARCESGAKSYGVYTMITATTLDAASRHGADLNCRKLDRIIVKGRSKPVEVYEVWDSTIPRKQSATCKRIYESALQAYFDGEWELASNGFAEAASFEPAKEYAPTTPSEVLAARCQEFIERGGPENWDGVYIMQSK